MYIKEKKPTQSITFLPCCTYGFLILDRLKSINLTYFFLHCFRNDHAGVLKHMESKIHVHIFPQNNKS